MSDRDDALPPLDAELLAYGGYPEGEDWAVVGRLMFDAVQQYKADAEGASLELQQGLAKQIIDGLIARWEGQSS